METAPQEKFKSRKATGYGYQVRERCQYTMVIAGGRKSLKG